MINRRQVAGLALAAWSSLLFLAYHSAWSGRFRPLVHQGPRVLILAGILLACWALGSVLHRRLTSGPAPADFGLMFALGLEAMAFLWLGLGFAHLMNAWVAWGILTVGAAAGAIALLAIPAPRIPKLSFAILAPTALALAGVLIVLPMAFAPPISTDALTYHLALPKWYADAGGLVALPRYSLAAFPPLMEMLYTWVLLLGQPVVAQLLHFAVGLVAVASAAFLCRAERGTFAGATTAAVLLTTPVILLNMSWAWLDVALALFVLLGTVTLFRAVDSGEKKLEVCAGVLWGGALGLKYTAVLYFAVALAGALLSKRAPLRSRLLAVVRIGAVAALLTAPFLVRNAVIYGNPAHPIGNKLWGPHLEGPFDRVYDAVQARARPIDSVKGIVSYTLENRWGDDSPGPLYLLALPVLLFMRKGTALRRLYAVGAVSMLILSAAFGGSVRYQIPAFFLLAAPIGAWLASLWGSGPLGRGAYALILALTALPNLATLAFHDRHQFDPLRVALGYETELTYLRRMGPSFSIFEWINTRTPPNARVIVLGERKLFYLDREAVVGSELDVSPMRDFVRGASSERQIAERLAVAGISFAIFDREAFLADIRNGSQRPFWSEDELRLLFSFFAKAAEPIAKAGTVELFRISDGRPSAGR